MFPRPVFSKAPIGIFGTVIEDDLATRRAASQVASELAELHNMYLVSTRLAKEAAKMKAAAKPPVPPRHPSTRLHGPVEHIYEEIDSYNISRFLVDPNKEQSDAKSGDGGSSSGSSTLKANTAVTQSGEDLVVDLQGRLLVPPGPNICSICYMDFVSRDKFSCEICGHDFYECVGQHLRRHAERGEFKIMRSKTWPM